MHGVKLLYRGKQECFTSVILCCLIQSVWSRSLLQASSSIFNVADNGAVGDGIIDDFQAFEKTWKETCASVGNSATFQISSGMKSLLSTSHFQGPCKSTNVHVSILGNIIAPVRANYTTNIESWIGFSNVSGLVVDGGGQIDGSGDSWWKCASPSPSDKLKGCMRPTSLKFHACKNLQINGISSVNSASNHISLNQCENAMISNVNLTAPGDSPNTDGIDISQSKYVSIQDSFIGTGDDCIAINSRSSFINITNISCGPGHGISVGSIGEGGKDAGVENVHVSSCGLTGTKNGVRIKTFKGGSGYARNITFEKITMNNVKNPIIIDESYCPHACDPLYGDGVQVSNITYTGIHGTSADARAIIFGCSSKIPCDNIYLQDINITTISGGPTTATCENAHGTSLSTVPPVPCLGG